jgi:tetratricopeptide (TPR) repeat protein
MPFLADFIARSHLAKGHKDKAIEEYERLVSPEPAARESALIHPFSRFRLAALYEDKGQIDRAVEQYESLLQTWRQADSGLPEVAVARKRLAELRAKAPRPRGAAVESFFTIPYIGSF